MAQPQAVIKNTELCINNTEFEEKKKKPTKLSLRGKIN